MLGRDAVDEIDGSASTSFSHYFIGHRLNREQQPLKVLSILGTIPVMLTGLSFFSTRLGLSARSGNAGNTWLVLYCSPNRGDRPHPHGFSRWEADTNPPRTISKPDRRALNSRNLEQFPRAIRERGGPGISADRASALPRQAPTKRRRLRPMGGRALSASASTRPPPYRLA